MNRSDQSVRQRRAKRLLVTMFGGCLDCGLVDSCLALYDFHHRDPGEKSFRIAGSHLMYRWSRLCAEAAKCDCLCANCHRRRHADD